MKKLLFLAFISLSVTACGSNTDEMTENEEENAVLKDEVVENGTEDENSKDNEAENTAFAEILTFGRWRPENVRNVLGRVESGAETTILADTSGIIGQMNVKLGQSARGGQKIINFVRDNNATAIGAENARLNLQAIELSAKASVDSAKSALEQVKITTNEAVKQAEIVLENAKNEAKTTLIQAETAINTAKNNNNVSNNAETANLDAQYASLQENVINVDQIIKDAENQLDLIFLVTPKRESSPSLPAYAEVGNHSRLQKSEIKNSVEKLLYRPRVPNLLPETRVNLLYFTQFRITELKIVREVLEQSLELARATSVNRIFSENTRVEILNLLNADLIAVQNAIVSLENTIKSIKTIELRSIQTLVGTEGQTESAEVAFENTKTSTESRIKSAEIALESAKANADSQIKQAENAIDTALANQKLQLAQAGNSLRTANASATDLVVEMPFNGIVTELLVDPGTQVSPGTPLLKVISSASRPIITAELGKNDFEVLKNTRNIQVRFQNGERTRLKSSEMAEIFDPVTQKLTVEFTISRLPNGVYAGELAQIELPTEKGQSGTLPITAVSFEPESAEILVLNEEGVAERRQIVTGKLMGDAIEVLDGVKDGEMVIRFRGRVESGTFVVPR